MTSDFFYKRCSNLTFHELVWNRFKPWRNRKIFRSWWWCKFCIYIGAERFHKLWWFYTSLRRLWSVGTDIPRYNWSVTKFIKINVIGFNWHLIFNKKRSSTLQRLRSSTTVSAHKRDTSPRSSTFLWKTRLPVVLYETALMPQHSILLQSAELREWSW